KAATERWLTSYTGLIALFTLALFIATSTQVGLFVWQLRLIRKGAEDATIAARAARDSADSAKDSVALAQRDQRPWVSVDMSIASPLTYDHNGDARITLRFILKNVGRSPATDVSVDTMIYPMSNKRRDDQLEQQRIAASSLV